MRVPDAVPIRPAVPKESRDNRQQPGCQKSARLTSRARCHALSESVISRENIAQQAQGCSFADGCSRAQLGTQPGVMRDFEMVPKEDFCPQALDALWFEGGDGRWNGAADIDPCRRDSTRNQRSVASSGCKISICKYSGRLCEMRTASQPGRWGPPYQACGR